MRQHCSALIGIICALLIFAVSPYSRLEQTSAAANELKANGGSTFVSVARYSSVTVSWGNVSYPSCSIVSGGVAIISSPTMSLPAGNTPISFDTVGRYDVVLNCTDSAGYGRLGLNVVTIDVYAGGDPPSSSGDSGSTTPPAIALGSDIKAAKQVNGVPGAFADSLSVTSTDSFYLKVITNFDAESCHIANVGGETYSSDIYLIRDGDSKTGLLLHGLLKTAATFEATCRRGSQTVADRITVSVSGSGGAVVVIPPPPATTQASLLNVDIWHTEGNGQTIGKQGDGSDGPVYVPWGQPLTVDWHVWPVSESTPTLASCSIHRRSFHPDSTNNFHDESFGSRALGEGQFTIDTRVPIDSPTDGQLVVTMSCDDTRGGGLVSDDLDVILTQIDPKIELWGRTRGTSDPYVQTELRVPADKQVVLKAGLEGNLSSCTLTDATGKQSGVDSSGAPGHRDRYVIIGPLDGDITYSFKCVGVVDPVVLHIVPVKQIRFVTENITNQSAVPDTTVVYAANRHDPLISVGRTQVGADHPNKAYIDAQIPVGSFLAWANKTGYAGQETSFTGTTSDTSPQEILIEMVPNAELPSRIYGTFKDSQGNNRTDLQVSIFRASDVHGNTSTVAPVALVPVERQGTFTGYLTDVFRLIGSASERKNFIVAYAVSSACGSQTCYELKTQAAVANFSLLKGRDAERNLVYDGDKNAYVNVTFQVAGQGVNVWDAPAELDSSMVEIKVYSPEGNIMKTVHANETFGAKPFSRLYYSINYSGNDSYASVCDMVEIRGGPRVTIGRLLPSAENDMEMTSGSRDNYNNFIGCPTCSFVK